MDGLAKEDLNFYYRNGNENSFGQVPNGWFEGSKPYLELAEQNGIEVFVVEYMTPARVTEYSTQLKAEIQYLNSHGIPIYISQDRDLTTIFAQPTGVGLPILTLNGSAASTESATALLTRSSAMQLQTRCMDGNDTLSGGASAGGRHLVTIQ